MSRRDVAALALRLLGLFALLQAIILFQALPFAIEGVTSVQRLLPILLALLATLAMAIVLWCKADRIAGTIFPGDDGTGVKPVSDLQQLQVVLLSAIGVYVLVHAIPSVVLTLANIVSSQLTTDPQAQQSGFMNRMWVNTVVASLVQIALGWLLATRPAAVARLLSRFQS